MNELFRYNVDKEISSARSKFEPFHSLHEGYAVLLEELAELQREVFKRPPERLNDNIYKECIQIAAMAYCITQECIPEGVL